MINRLSLVFLFSTAACLNTTHINAEQKYTNFWSLQTGITLYRCSSRIIRSQSEIERFMQNICVRMGLTRHDNTSFLYHYAGNGYSSGLSALQHANGHTDIALRVDESTDSVYIDLFSCAPYDPYRIACYAQDFFDAYDMNYESIRR